LRNALGSSNLRYFLGLHFLSTLVIFTYSSNFTLVLQEQLDLPAKYNGLLMSYNGLLSVITSWLLLPWLLKLFPDSTLIWRTVVVSGMCLFGLSLVHSVVMLGVILIPFTIATEVLRTSIMSSITKQAPKEQIGTIVGLTDSIASLCRVITPIVGGILIQQLGPAWPALAGGIMSILIALWIKVLKPPELQRSDGDQMQ